MKKSDVLLQISENARANDIFNRAMDEYRATRGAKSKKFRSCSAEIIETENFYILLSYRTFIAALEKSTDTLADVLRTEYGYTSTSAQHIAKFSHEYGAGKWGAENRVRSVNISPDDLAKVYYVNGTDNRLMTLKEARKEWKEDGEVGNFWRWYDVSDVPLPDANEMPAALTA